jgi:hypothetical protein
MLFYVCSFITVLKLFYRLKFYFLHPLAISYVHSYLIQIVNFCTFRFLTLISLKWWTHIRKIRNNRLILAQFQTVSTQEYAKVYCTYKSAIIIGPDHKLRSASYQNLPICMKVVSRQTCAYYDLEKYVCKGLNCKIIKHSRTRTATVASFSKTTIAQFLSSRIEKKEWNKKENLHCNTVFAIGNFKVRDHPFKTSANFEPLPPTIGIPAKCLWRGFLILIYCDLLTIGIWGHPSPSTACWRLKWMVPK